MKRSYKKPCIHYEDFGVLSANGSPCEGIAYFGDMYTCPVKVKGYSDLDLGFGEIGTVFTLQAQCDSTGGGTDPSIEPTPYTEDLICYHAPSEDNNVFSS